MGIMKTMLIKVIDDGEKLQLMDGSEWLINHSDIPTVCTWLSTSEIKIENINSTDMFSYRLTNLNKGVSIAANENKLTY